MSELAYTLLSDGSSDASLIPILDWLLRVNGVVCAIQGEWADLRRLPRPPTRLGPRISKAVELFPCELLFVHRDAEAEAYEMRRREIEQAVTFATFDGVLRPQCVCVVPVRMREAWLLFDENAIRRAAGNPVGKVPLLLPGLHNCEGLPDPKGLLHRLLAEASELGARRRARLNISLMARRITEYIDDFSRLRTLAAFAALETDLQQVIARNEWARRR